MSIQLVFNPPPCPHINTFAGRIWCETVNGLPEAQVGNILSSSLICSLFSWHLPGQSLHHRGLSSWSSTTSPWWSHALLLIISLSLICLKCFSGSILHHIPRNQGEADQPVVPWVLLFVLFEDRHDVFFPGLSAQFPVTTVKDFSLLCVLWHKLLHLLAASFGRPSRSNA